jgi:hypothetical protein
MFAARPGLSIPLLILGLGWLQGCIFISDGEHKERRADLLTDSRLEDTGPGEPRDADGDGYDESVDCDDQDDGIHPDADELCNGLDDDCDDRVDEADALDATTWYRDEDQDGYGDGERSLRACGTPSGYVDRAGDCDDLQDSVHPDAEERCNGHDDDCDGELDEDDAVDAPTWWLDADGDGWGDPGTTATRCELPSGHVVPSGSSDCDDGDAGVHPGAEETCDGVDQDCDGGVDEGATDMGTWYADADADGYGDPDITVESCEVPSGHVSDASDCDDRDASIHPGASETCDTVDEDCDGDVDEGAIDMGTWYADTDADGYGDPASPTTACRQPSGSTADDRDCDDGDASVHPGATEHCDRVDEDCDGDVDEGAIDMGTWYTDADADGYGDPASATAACSQPSGTSAEGTDCDDTDAGIHPGATEYCDGVDEDCDGALNTDGTVTHFDGSAVPTDLSARFTGSSGSAASVSLADDGTVVFCDGTYYAHLEITASSLYVMGLNGAATTTISGDGSDTVIRIASGGSVDLYGLTVTGGDGAQGGGLYASDPSLALDITACDFGSNRADQGGGLYLEDLTLSMRSCSLAGNIADDEGGGLYLSGVVADLDSVSIGGCEAGLDGGGIYATASTLGSIDGSFDTNVAHEDGGGIAVVSSDLIISGGIFLDNEADQGGGGLHLRDSGALIEACTIQTNLAGDWGGGLALISSTADLVSTLVYGNDTTGGGFYEVGGGALVYDGSTLTCTGSAAETAGFLANLADDGGGVYLSSSSDRLDSISCDWGDGHDDNDPDDVDLGLFGGSSYRSYRDDESFSCAGGTSGACL